MTYAAFLALFLLVPLVALAAVLRGRLLRKRFLALALALAGIALAYMAPWDHAAAVWGIWTWTPGRTWGLRWWAVPPEEYLFCALEALLAVTLTYAVLARRWQGTTQPQTQADGPADEPSEASREAEPPSRSEAGV